MVVWSLVYANNFFIYFPVPLPDHKDRRTDELNQGNPINQIARNKTDITRGPHNKYIQNPTVLKQNKIIINETKGRTTIQTKTTPSCSIRNIIRVRYLASNKSETFTNKIICYENC